MKYAITGPRGRIFQIVDTEPTEAPYYSEISDADAATVEASSDTFFIVGGVLKTQSEFVADKQQERHIDKLNSYTDVDQAKEYARGYFAQKRYDFEVGGINVGGIDVRTDRFTVDRIYQARFLASLDNTFTTDWKLGDGSFLTIDAATITAISDGVTAHIKDSFQKEKAANDSITAATTIQELTAIQY